MNIPILLSCDNHYATQLLVTIISILENRTKENHYSFYCMVSGDFQEVNKLRIIKKLNVYENLDIEFIDMGNTFSDLTMPIAHLTSPTYFRLMAPDLLPRIDKILYFDVDVIVKCDLAYFYNEIDDENFVVGVRAPYTYLMPEIERQNYAQFLGIADVNCYINAGVLGINLKLIRERNLTPTLIDLIPLNFPTVDQDIINKVFYGGIKHVDFTYNFMTKYKDFLGQIADKIGKEEIKQALESPQIIHYADKIKPWSNPNCWMGDEWWKYAKVSDQLEFVFFHNFNNIQLSLRDDFRLALSLPSLRIKYILFKILTLLSLGSSKKNRKKQRNILRDKIIKAKSILES